MGKGARRTDENETMSSWTDIGRHLLRGVRNVRTFCLSVSGGSAQYCLNSVINYSVVVIEQLKVVF